MSKHVKKGRLRCWRKLPLTVAPPLPLTPQLEKGTPKDLLHMFVQARTGQAGQASLQRDRLAGMQGAVTGGPQLHFRTEGSRTAWNRHPEAHWRGDSIWDPSYKSDRRAKVVGEAHSKEDASTPGTGVRGRRWCLLNPGAQNPNWRVPELAGRVIQWVTWQKLASQNRCH